MRYDAQKEIYRDCKWCTGRGCLYCKSEADKAYRSAFQDGPQPIATFTMSTPEDVERAKELIGVDAIRKHFGPGGGGMADFLLSLKT